MLTSRALFRSLEELVRAVAKLGLLPVAMTPVAQLRSLYVVAILGELLGRDQKKAGSTKE